MRLAAIVAVALGSVLTGTVLGDVFNECKQQPAAAAVKAVQQQQPETAAQKKDGANQVKGGGAGKACAMCGAQAGAVARQCGCSFHDSCYAPFKTGVECPVCKTARS